MSFVYWFQVEDMENEWCAFQPSFAEITDALCATVDHMVQRTEHLPQVHHLLFHEVEQITLTYLSGVISDPSNVDEDIMRDIKQRIKTVIHANTEGPNRLDFLNNVFKLCKILQKYCAIMQCLKDCYLHIT